MAEANATLNIFYEEWKLYQDHLREAIAPLTAEQLAFCAGPGLRTIGQIATHIITARVGWFIDFLGEDGGEAAYLNDWDGRDASPRPAAELVRGLDLSWQLMAAALYRWSAADMAKTFPIEWRGDHYDLTRSWVIWHLL